MRSLVINRDLTIDESHEAMDDWMGEQDWDAVRIDDRHDAYIHDEGLFEPGVVVVTIGGHKIPLPAIVTGFEGEEMTPATITIEALREMIT